MENKKYNINDVIRIANILKLKSIESNLNKMLELAILEKWTNETLLYKLFNEEFIRKEKALKKAIIKRANFPQMKYLSSIVREELPESMQIILPKLETLDFIKEGRNVVLTGNPGTGKTHVAIALGIEACKHRYRVLFTTIHQLLTKIHETRSQRSLHQLELAFMKYDLVICDELGYITLNKENADMLFNLLSLRAEIKSTIVTTNLAFDKWETVFADKVLSGAIIDRITHKAYIANMVGESYRTKETLKFNKQLR